MHEDKFKIESYNLPVKQPYSITCDGYEILNTSRQGLELLYHKLGLFLAADEKN